MAHGDPPRRRPSGAPCVGRRPSATVNSTRQPGLAPLDAPAPGAQTARLTSGGEAPEAAYRAPGRTGGSTAMTIERFDDGEVQPDVIAFDHDGVEPGEPGDDGPEHRAAARKIPNADQRPTKPPDRWRELVVLAQDPTVKIGGRAIRAKVRVPREDLMPGPRGHRFQVVDFDATNPARLENQVIEDAVPQDAWLTVDDAALVESAAFRAQNVDATAARTRDTFEQALGRRVPWSHAGHQLFLVPKAFPEATAFYAPDAPPFFFALLTRPDGG